MISDIFFDYNSFRRHFTDDFLTFLIVSEGFKGESPIIEFKKAYNDKKAKKIALIIASLANSESGILFFGWDEEKKHFSDVDVEKLEQQVIQLISNFISPNLQCLIHKLKHPFGYGLFISVPRDGKIHSVKKETAIRVGSHTTILGASEIIKLDKSLFSRNKGHIQLITLENQYKEQFDIKKEDFKAYITLFEGLHTLKKIKTDLICLPKNWKLDIKEWHFDKSISGIFRIPFQRWVPQSVSPLISKANNLIDQLTMTLSNRPFKPGENVHLINLLRDSSLKKNNLTNHRRCLNTYVTQNNPWNFTDWKYLIEPISSNQLRLYYVEGIQPDKGIPRQKTIETYQILSLTTEIINKKTIEIVTSLYEISAKNLINNIITQLELIITGFKANVFS
jgi:hypothetical protein